MLRITRRAGERILIGDDVIVEVMEIRGQTVRIGIDAPRALAVYREELWLDIKRENQAAAASDLDAFPGIPGPAGPAGRKEP